MAIRKPDVRDEQDVEATPARASETHAEWLERIKSVPGVIVHERDPNYVVGTYKPSIKLAKPIDVLFLLGRRNADGSRRSDRS